MTCVGPIIIYYVKMIPRNKNIIVGVRSYQKRRIETTYERERERERSTSEGSVCVCVTLFTIFLPHLPFGRKEFVGSRSR